MASLGRNMWKKDRLGLDLSDATKTQPGDAKDNDNGPTYRLQRSSSHGTLSTRVTSKMFRYRRSGPRLQLPSFEDLGISSLRPNKSGVPRLALQRPFHDSDPPALSSPVPFLGSAPLLTPPDDIDSIKWNTACGHPAGHAGSAKPKSSAAPTTGDSGMATASAGANDSSTDTGEHSQGSGQTTDSAGSERPDSHHLDTEQALRFLDLGIGANISSVTTPEAQSNGITVISQTLPHPLQDTPNPHSAFTSTIQAIHSRFDGRRPPYIKITHAVPPQFTLRNLPSSPPGTPNQQGGEDYFSLSVFANAAPVATYHLVDGSIDKDAPSSPAPIVPPSTVQVALVERYIPPSTIQEHRAFFSTRGPSALIDRLVELSPNGGSLMLVYPTRRGAQSFCWDYLGPLLDSLLRNMVVVHDMSSDLASSLGRMPAVAQMLSFEEMKDKLTTLCRYLSRPTSSPSRQPEYSLVYANAGSMPLDRAAWSEWFLQQESPRMKAILKSYWQRGKRLPTSSESVIPATLIRDVKICIEQGEYENGPPQKGIEVGCFVMRRSK